VIEHLFTYENQHRTASEMGRVGKAFWVQTPKFWFPWSRISMYRGGNGCQWNCECRSFGVGNAAGEAPVQIRYRARELVRELRLLSGSELKRMFPGATLLPERFCGLVKLWTVMGGFPSQVRNS